MDLLEITERALARLGAVVEREDQETLAVALDPAIAARLDIPEWARLSSSPQAAGCILVAPQAPLLERLQAIVETRGGFAAFEAPLQPLREIDAAAMLAREFAVLNGTYRLLESGQRAASYYLFHFRYDAVADDRQEGLVTACVSADGLNAPRMISELAFTGGAGSPTASMPEAAEVTAAAEAATRLARWKAGQALGEFANSLVQRLRRDTRRVGEYFAELEGQLDRRRARRPAGVQDELEKRENQRLALRMECRRQLEELRDKARLQVRLSLVAFARIDTAARFIEIEVRRRRNSFRRTLLWNPLDRALDRLLCGTCGRPTLAIAVRDEDLHCLCAECHAQMDAKRSGNR